VTDLRFEDLPPDLLDALHRYGHLIPQSRTINLVVGAYDAPATTASAMTAGQWMHAWVAEWQRANRAEVALGELHEQGRRLVELEAALGGLVALAERLGQGLDPVAPEVVEAKRVLERPTS
jgi:hypothetical protein